MLFRITGSAWRDRKIAEGFETICDALRVVTPGVLTLAINRRLVTRGIAVEDRDTQQAMGRLFATAKLVAEPAGAIALAALLNGSYDARGKTVVVMCSGGNVSPETFNAALSLPPPGRH